MIPKLPICYRCKQEIPEGESYNVDPLGDSWCHKCYFEVFQAVRPDIAPPFDRGAYVYYCEACYSIIWPTDEFYLNQVTNKVLCKDHCQELDDNYSLIPAVAGERI